MKAQQGPDCPSDARQNDPADMAPSDSHSGTGTAATDGNLPVADEGALSQQIAAVDLDNLDDLDDLDDLDIHEDMPKEALVAIVRALRDKLIRDMEEVERIANETRAMKEKRENTRVQMLANQVEDMKEQLTQRSRQRDEERDERRRRYDHLLDRLRTVPQKP